MAPAIAICSLPDLLVEPAAGPCRIGAAKSTAETEALLALSRTLAQEPSRALQRLVDLAMKLTGADSAGLSLEDSEGGERVFRWVATTGELARYVNTAMPRDESPSRAAVEARRALLVRDPVRHYPSIRQLHVPVRLALLVPFARTGRTVGTLWVVAHGKQKVFTTEDVRVVQALTTFASAVLDTLAPGRRAA
jgi:GAF domain-containing protein